MNAAGDDPTGDWHRAQGVECNNGIWDLVGKAERTAADDEEMLRRAYGAAYHWQRAKGAGPANEARARALLALGHEQDGLDEWAAAKAVPIVDPEDKAILDGDFADAP